MENLLSIFNFLGSFFGIVASFGSLSAYDVYTGWSSGSWYITYNNLYNGVSSSFRFFTLADLVDIVGTVFPVLSGIFGTINSFIVDLVFAPALFFGIVSAPFWFVTMVTVVFWGVTIALLSRVVRLIKDLLNPLN